MPANARPRVRAVVPDADATAGELLGAVARVVQGFGARIAADLRQRRSGASAPLQQPPKQQKPHRVAGAGANVSHKDKWGDTPLGQATINGHEEIRKILLSIGVWRR